MQINHNILSFEDLNSFIPVWSTSCGMAGVPPSHITICYLIFVEPWSIFVNNSIWCDFFLSAFVTGKRAWSKAHGVNDKSLGNWTRGHFDSKSSEAESESYLQSAGTARSVLFSRDRNAPAAAHCIKKLFCSATDTVGLSVPQARGYARLQKMFQRSR